MKTSKCSFHSLDKVDELIIFVEILPCGLICIVCKTELKIGFLYVGLVNCRLLSQQLDKNLAQTDRPRFFLPKQIFYFAYY